MQDEITKRLEQYIVNFSGSITEWNLQYVTGVIDGLRLAREVVNNPNLKYYVEHIDD